MRMELGPLHKALSSVKTCKLSLMKNPVGTGVPTYGCEWVQCLPFVLLVTKHHQLSIRSLF